MSKLWQNVTEKHVLDAIELFDQQKGNYPRARNTFLLYNNKKYPGKHIRGIAFKIANRAEISKNEYSGGMETVIFFKKLKFTMEHDGKTIYPQ